MEQQFAIPDSPDYVGQMVPSHEHVPAITPDVGQFDPEDLLDVDEETMSEDSTPLVSRSITHISSCARLLKCMFRTTE